MLCLLPNIILFDGECYFCDHSVQFIIKRDKQELYHFASIQSDIGQELLRKYNVPRHIDSLILIEGNQFYIKSTAALKISKNLKGVWKLFYSFILIPTPLRDYLYDRVASKRYTWFGKKNSCELPSPEIRKRFLSS